jgi:hypothetical protein
MMARCNASVAMMRDLADVVDNEKAKIGDIHRACTKPMQTEAVKAGFYHCMSQ